MISNKNRMFKIEIFDFPFILERGHVPSLFTLKDLWS